MPGIPVDRRRPLQFTGGAGAGDEGLPWINEKRSDIPMKGLKIVLAAGMAALALSLPTGAGAAASFQLKGGVNLADFSDFEMVTEQSASMSNVSAIGTQRLVGFAAGAALRLPLTGMIALQPEALYSRKGVKTDTYELFGQEASSEWRMNYIDVPILVVLTLNDRIDLYGGPYADFYLDGEVETKAAGLSGTVDIDSDGLTSPGYGAVVGGAVHFGSFLVEGRYYHGISDILDTDTVSGDQSEISFDEEIASFHHRVIQILFGITL